MSKSLWLTAIGVLVLILVAVFAIRLSSNKGEDSIVNQAGEAIRSGQLEICKQQFSLGQVQPKQSKEIHYKVRSDSHYDVTIEFESGKKLSRQVGYVTSGMDFHDRLTVTDDDVSLSSRD